MEKVNKCFDELKDTESFSNSSQSQIFEQEFHRKKERINANLKFSEKTTNKNSVDIEEINNWISILRSQSDILQSTEQADKLIKDPDLEKSKDEIDNNANSIYFFQNNLINQLRNVIKTQNSPTTSRLMQLYLYCLNNLKIRRDFLNKLSHSIDEATIKLNRLYRENSDLMGTMDSSQIQLNHFKDRDNYHTIQKAKKYHIMEIEFEKKKKCLRQEIAEIENERDEYKTKEKSEPKLLSQIRHNEEELSRFMIVYQDRLVQMKADIKNSQDSYKSLMALLQNELKSQRNAQLKSEKKDLAELKKQLTSNLTKFLSETKKTVANEIKTLEKELKKFGTCDESIEYIEFIQNETFSKTNSLFRSEVNQLKIHLKDYEINLERECSLFTDETMLTLTQETNIQHSQKNRLQQLLNERDLELKAINNQLSVYEDLCLDVIKIYKQIKNSNKEKEQALSEPEKIQWEKKKEMKRSIRQIEIFIDKAQELTEELKNRLKVRMSDKKPEDDFISSHFDKTRTLKPKMKRSNSMIYGTERDIYQKVDTFKRILNYKYENRASTKPLTIITQPSTPQNKSSRKSAKLKSPGSPSSKSSPFSQSKSIYPSRSKGDFNLSKGTKLSKKSTDSANSSATSSKKSLNNPIPLDSSLPSSMKNSVLSLIDQNNSLDDNDLTNRNILTSAINNSESINQVNLTNETTNKKESNEDIPKNTSIPPSNNNLLNQIDKINQNNNQQDDCTNGDLINQTDNQKDFVNRNDLLNQTDLAQKSDCNNHQKQQISSLTEMKSQPENKEKEIKPHKKSGHFIAKEIKDNSINRNIDIPLADNSVNNHPNRTNLQNNNNLDTIQDNSTNINPNNDEIKSKPKYDLVHKPKIESKQNECNNVNDQNNGNTQRTSKRSEINSTTNQNSDKQINQPSNSSNQIDHNSRMKSASYIPTNQLENNPPQSRNISQELITCNHSQTTDIIHQNPNSNKDQSSINQSNQVNELPPLNNHLQKHEQIQQSNSIKQLPNEQLEPLREMTQNRINYDSNKESVNQSKSKDQITNQIKLNDPISSETQNSINTIEQFDGSNQNNSVNNDSINPSKSKTQLTIPTLNQTRPKNRFNSIDTSNRLNQMKTTDPQKDVKAQNSIQSNKNFLPNQTPPLLENDYQLTTQKAFAKNLPVHSNLPKVDFKSNDLGVSFDVHVYKTLDGNFLNTNLCYDLTEDFYQDNQLKHKYRHWNGTKANFDPQYDFYDENGILHHIYQVNLKENFHQKAIAPHTERSCGFITDEIKRKRNRERRTSEIGNIISYKNQTKPMKESKECIVNEVQSNKPLLHSPYESQSHLPMKTIQNNNEETAQKIDTQFNSNNETSQLSKLALRCDNSSNFTREPFTVLKNDEVADQKNKKIPNKIFHITTMNNLGNSKSGNTSPRKMIRVAPNDAQHDFDTDPIRTRQSQSVRANRTNTFLPPIAKLASTVSFSPSSPICSYSPFEKTSIFGNLSDTNDLGVYATKNGPRCSNFSARRDADADSNILRGISNQITKMRGSMELSSRKTGRIMSVKTFSPAKKTVASYQRSSY